MTFREKFKKVERDYTPLYQAEHGKYVNGHYDVEHYWSASVEGVPSWDKESGNAVLKWRCLIVAEWTSLAEWSCDTLVEAFASLEREVTDRPKRKVWIQP